jgi:delta14-sterol reductase
MDELILPVTAASLLTATKMVGGYMIAMFLGALLLPGLERLGYEQPNGERAAYKLTGMTLFFITHLVLAAATFGFGISLTPILTHFWSIFVLANLVALFWSLGLYVWGRRSGDVLKGHVGDDLPLPSFVKDLWFGNELNPRWLGVDIKMFMYQPSLIGVYLVVLSFAYAQHELYGAIAPQMWCFLFFWWTYLFSHYVKEEFMLSTWDVIAENFGFMLVWGDLVYVPFLYSLPGWWILHHTEPFTTAEWLGLVAFHLAALYVFREANWQKERYKRDKQAHIWGKAPETIGGRLLVSGFWGIGRKINYTGEIGVYISFALCAGLSSPYPYLLPLSLLALLTQRAARDDKKCRAKYGKQWEAYCKRARFRIIPFVY